MLRVITLNLNGIRSAVAKGLLPWLEKQGADIVCIQELKAQDGDLSEEMRAPGGCHGWFHPAEKKGYSGVAIYARHRPDQVSTGVGNAEFDAEGRYIRADFGKLSVVSVYLPSGSSSEERQQAKFRFMDLFRPRLEELVQDAHRSGREILLCGDWNIAHREIDLKNWRGNRKNSGFLPEERAWLTEIFDGLGWVDVYRKLYPEAGEEGYTWWSNRGQAWAKNVGWRIDYHVATPGIAALARSAQIYKDQRFSDHSPLTIDYTWDIPGSSAAAIAPRRKSR